MYKYIFTLLSIAAANFLYAQNANVSSVVSKSYAFSRQNMYGTIPVDPATGQQVKPPITFSYMIFLETKGTTLPEWKTAWINGKAYSITSQAVESGVDVGTIINDDKVTVLKARNGYKLWQLNVLPATGIKKPYFTRQQRTAKVVLQGTYKNKPVLYTINKIGNLEPYAVP